MRTARHRNRMAGKHGWVEQQQLETNPTPGKSANMAPGTRDCKDGGGVGAKQRHLVGPIHKGTRITKGCMHMPCARGIAPPVLTTTIPGYNSIASQQPRTKNDDIVGAYVVQRRTSRGWACRSHPESLIHTSIIKTDPFFLCGNSRP